MSGIGPSGVALYVDGSCKFNQRVGEVTRDAGWGVVCLSVEDREYGEEIGGPVVQRHLRPLPGGELWGPVVLDASSALHLAAEYGSNNTAELSAIAEALHWLLEHRPVMPVATKAAASRAADPTLPAVLFHDSEYAANVAAGRLNAHKNVALVRNVRDLLERVEAAGCWDVIFEHVRSHSDDFWNDRADALAKHGATGALCASTSRLSTARASESRFRDAPAEIVAAMPPLLPPLPPPPLPPHVLPLQQGGTRPASDVGAAARREALSDGYSDVDGDTTRLQSEFNSRVRRETDFNGRAMVKLKLTQTYRQFLRSVSGDAPLPPGLAYNAELHVLTQKQQHTQCFSTAAVWEWGQGK